MHFNSVVRRGGSEIFFNSYNRGLTGRFYILFLSIGEMSNFKRYFIVLRVFVKNSIYCVNF